MEPQYFVQKRWIGGGPIGPPKPLYGNRPMASQNITSEGVDAVAGALGMERLPQQPVKMSGLPPADHLAEGLRRISEGE